MNALARVLFGILLAGAGLALLGFEIQVSLELRQSVHVVHVIGSIILLMAAWTTMFFETAAAFFSWLVSLRSGGKDRD